MISKQRVIKAIKVVCQNQVLPMDELDKQIASSLLVYKRRGELHGDTNSAIDCLVQAGYEIEGYKQKGEE